MSSSALISLEAVRVARGGRDILGGIDLSVTTGEQVAVLGASGAGKSTLLQAIAGLASPTSGTITISGNRLNGPAASVTMMLQRPALLPWASAYENVLLGLRFSGEASRDPTGSRDRALELLTTVGLADRAAARPSELSGGEQQRVALARALAPRPKVLLLDEPFSALDHVTRAALRTDVARLVADQGVTLLLVTHDRADATALCRRIVRLDGRPARIVADDRIGSPGAPSPDHSRAAVAA